MLEEISSLNFFDEIKIDEFFKLYETSIPETDREIKSKIKQYKNIIEFFNFYFKNDINNLLSSIKETEKNLVFFCNEQDNISNPNTEIDNYISYISKIVIIINSICKIEQLIKNLIIESKKNLSTQFNKTKIESKLYDKYSEIFNNLSDNSSFNNTPKFVHLKNLNLVDLIKNENIRSKAPHKNILNKPHFSIPQKKLKNEKRKNTENLIVFKGINDLLDNDIPDDSTKSQVKIKRGRKKTSCFSFSSISFSPAKSKKSEDLKIEMKNLKSSKTLREENKYYSNINNYLYRELLELINNLYKKCQINSEEKVKLKKLIINKSEKLEKLYLDYSHKDKLNDIQFIVELKNIIGENE